MVQPRHFSGSSANSMAQGLQPREIEEAAIALHRMDKAENAIEPRPVVGLDFPGDDLASQGF